MFYYDLETDLHSVSKKKEVTTCVTCENADVVNQNASKTNLPQVFIRR